MRITIRFFALLREKAGLSEWAMEAPFNTTVAQATDMLAARFPAIAAALPRTAFAVNMSKVGGETILKEGDELALLPPVSGG